MTEDTQQIGKPNAPIVESHIGGVSVRGWIVVMAISTICAHELSILGWAFFTKSAVPKVEEPFYSLLMLVVGYYFGQKTQPQTK